MLSDDQGRTAAQSIAFNVQESSLPTGIGLASPYTVKLGSSQTTELFVSVVAGSAPLSTGLAVTADLSSIGGGTTQVFDEVGPPGSQSASYKIFKFTVTVPDGTSLGLKFLPVTVSDAQSRSTNAIIELNVSDDVFFSDFE